MNDEALLTPAQRACARAVAWNKANRERRLEIQKKWRLANREKANRLSADWRAKNRERSLENGRKNAKV
jgi:hypothetical protein